MKEDRNGNIVAEIKEQFNEMDEDDEEAFDL